MKQALLSKHLPNPAPHTLTSELATTEACFAWLMLMLSFESPAPCENVNALELAFSSHQLVLGGQEPNESLSSGHSLGLLRRVLWDKEKFWKGEYCKGPIWWLRSWGQPWGPCQWSPPLNVCFPREGPDLGRDNRRRLISHNHWENS